MYRIYVNYNDEVIEEYDSDIAYRIIIHLDKHNMLQDAYYVDKYGKSSRVR